MLSATSQHVNPLIVVHWLLPRRLQKKLTCLGWFWAPLIPLEGGLAVGANQRVINLANYERRFLQIQHNINKLWGRLWFWWELTMHKLYHFCHHHLWDQKRESCSMIVRSNIGYTRCLLQVWPDCFHVIISMLLIQFGHKHNGSADDAMTLMGSDVGEVTKK